jgi:arylsulfatase A-like enzyme
VQVRALRQIDGQDCWSVQRDTDRRRSGRPWFFLVHVALLALAADPADAQVISANFFHSVGVVGPSEKSGIVLVDGWNDIQVPGGGGVLNPATGFGPVTLNDSTGVAAASLTSTLGSYYNGGSGSAATGLGATLMAEYVSWDSATDGVSPDDTGTLIVSGLDQQYTGPGYDVYVYFDTDINDRVHTITVDGENLIGADSSTFNGVWVEASGALNDANYAVFRGLTSPTFAIGMDSSTGRGAVNGLQIVSASYSPPSPSGPNILLFVVDDMGWQDLSVPFADQPTVWNGLYATPNLEALANAGMKFTNAYAASTICSPTRTSLLTGRNPARTGITNWISTVGRSDGNLIVTDPVWTSEGLQPGDGNTTLPTVLRDEGYLTAHIGKAHLGAQGTAGADPIQLGFDINIAGSDAGNVPTYSGDYGGSTVTPGLEAYFGTGTYLNDALNAEALKVIDQAIASSRPFFLNMAHYVVHTPLEGQGDPNFLPAYSSRPTPEDDYAAMIASVDASAGALIAHLQTRGIADDTLFLFVSDNGGLSRFLRYDSANPLDPWHTNEHNRPLASGKGSAMEGGLRVPMIVAWAGQDPVSPPVQPTLPIPPGSIADEPVHTDDVFETLLHIAGVADPSAYLAETDGVNLGPLLSGLPFARGEPLVFHYPHQWLGEPGIGPGIEPFTAARDGRWKLIYYWSSRSFALYDLDEDLGETTNLVNLQTGVVASLGAAMTDWLVAEGAQLPRDAVTLVTEPLPVLPPPGCADGIDNDGDGLIDAAEDFGCTDSSDTSEWQTTLPCDNGIDDDGDGHADLADPVCQGVLSGSEEAECQDGVDNDGEPGTDFDGGESILGTGNGDPLGADPDCVVAWHDLEAGSGTPTALPALSAQNTRFVGLVLLLLGVSAARRGNTGPRLNG